MESDSDSNIFRNNLCSHVQWEGSYNGREDLLNFRYNGAFNMIDATNLVFEGNHVAGTERMGFHLPPESCNVASVRNPYMNNVAHTGMIGIGILPKTSIMTGEFGEYILTLNSGL